MAWIERSRRLVREKHRRFHREHAGQHHAGALAAGKLLHRPIRQIERARAGHCGLNNGGIARAKARGIIRAMRKPPERDDIAHRQRPMHLMSLREIGEALRTRAPGEGGQRHALESQIARRRHETGEGAQQRRLARAVRSDQHHQTTSGKRERDIAHDRLAGETDGKPARFEDRATFSGASHAADPPARLRRSRTMR